MSATSYSSRKLLLNRRTLDYLLNTLAKVDSNLQQRSTRRPLCTAKNLISTEQQQQQQPLICNKSDQLRYITTSSSPLLDSAGCARRAFRSQPSSLVAKPVKTHTRRDVSTQAQQQLAQLQLQQTNGHEQEPAYEEDDNFDDPLPGFHKKREASFNSDDLLVLKCQAHEMRPKVSVDKLVFGHVFTDHMFRVDWDLERGWSQPLISKVHNLDLHPGAKVLHYALEAFEGAKAYRGHDNKIRFFRLDQNVRRLQDSARRLALPDFDANELIKCIHTLVQLDQDWVPRGHLTSLYIRPTIMGVDPSLGVAGSKKALLYVLLSPAGPYFKTGFKPVSLYADPNFVRAWPGGAGNTKLGSNYAPTIAAQREAERLGLQQVLWLFGDEMRLTEVGTMNIFISLRNKETAKTHLVTPPLTDGLILPGITRNSILELAKQWDDVITEERYVTISELKQLLNEGSVIEMFGAGTAAIVCPISSIHMRDGTQLKIPYTDVSRPNGSGHSEIGAPSLTRRILKTITDIQYGRIEHPWAQELSSS